MEDLVEVFVQPPPDELKCPICFDLLKDPIITRDCGHTFCRTCFLRSIEAKANCPTCRTAVTAPDQIFPNRVVAEFLDGLLIYCKNGLVKKTIGHAPPSHCATTTSEEWLLDTTKCTTTFKRSQRKTHEVNCEFISTKCPHHDKGCCFSGPRSKVKEHIQECTFEKFKLYIQKNDEQIELLKQMIKLQAAEVQTLKKKVAHLSRSMSLVSSQTSIIVQKNQKNNNMNGTENDGTEDEDYEEIKELDDDEEELNHHQLKLEEPDIPIRELFSRNHINCSVTLSAHGDTVESLTADDKHLYSASWDHTIKVWDMDKFTLKQTLTCNSDVRELAIFNKKLYSGCGNGAIQVWDLESLHCIASVKRHDDDVLALKFVDNRLFSGSSDSTIKIWDPYTMECLHSLNGHTNWVFAITYAQGKIFSGSSDHTIKVWDAETLLCVQTLGGHNDQVRALAIADGHLFSGSYDCTIKVWDINSLQCIHTLHVYNEVFGLGAAGGHLFSGDENGTIKVWDLSSLRCLHTLNEHSGSVYAFAVARGCLFSASSDTTIKVWSK